MIWHILTIYYALGIILIAILIFYHQLFEANEEQKISKDEPIKDLLSLLLFILFGALVWPYLAYLKLTERSSELPPDFSVDIDDLETKLQLIEIEQIHLISDPLNAVSSEPFGHLSQAWKDFKQNIQISDAIWSFHKEFTKYNRKSKRNGYAVVDASGEIKQYFIYESFDIR